MTISLLYVDAGKGHYVPAKAMGDVLAARGYDARLKTFLSLLIQHSGIGFVKRSGASF